MKTFIHQTNSKYLLQQLAVIIVLSFIPHEMVAENYDLWIGYKQIQVTSENCSDYSFDPVSSTLTLSSSNYIDAIYSGLPHLTVKFSEGCFTGYIWFQAPANNPSATGTLTFIKDDSTGDECELNLSGNQEDPCIKGFSSFDYSGLTIMEEGAYYDTSNKKLVGNNGDMYFASFSSMTFLKPNVSRQWNGVGSSRVTLRNPNIPATGGPAYGTIKYSIVYANGTAGVTNQTYEDPFVIYATGTLTAWVQMNETKSENSVGKLYGFAGDLETTFQPSIQAPSILPTMPSGAYVTYMDATASSEPTNTIDETSGLITINGTGTDSYEGYFTVVTNDIILNEASDNGYDLGTFSLTVTPKPLESSMIQNITDQTYSGSTITPTVTIKNGDVTLVEGTDYTLIFADNINAGTATVTATGINNYTGSASKTFSIAKASTTVTFPKTTYNAEVGVAFQSPTATTSPSGLTVNYTSSKTTIARVNATTGEVTIVGEGETTITATFAGNNNYSTSSASYTLTVIDNSTKYDLWIGDTRVTERNCSDILGDGNANQTGTGSFQYVPDLNKLFITNTDANLKVETKDPKGLTVYLAPRSANAVGSIVYTGNSNAPLTITTDGNYPGTISLSANTDVISGFSILTLEQNLVIMEPEDITYDSNNKRLGTTSATIGVPLSPITDDEPILPDGNELKPEGGSNDVNKVVDDILYTLGNVNNNEGDGYDDEGCIVINSVTSDQQAAQVTQNCTPGTDEYLEGFKGLTFMVPAGNGTIKFDVQTLEGYVMKVMVGDAAPVTVEKTDKGVFEVPYNVAEPTYVYAYNGGKTGDGYNARSIHKGKKTTVHIKIYSISISSKKVKSANPASEASGGSYKGDTSELEGQTILSGEEIEAGKGDVNGDTVVNAADVVEMVNAIAGKKSTTFDKTAADLNGDGVVNISDIMKIVKKVFKQ